MFEDCKQENSLIHIFVDRQEVSSTPFGYATYFGQIASMRKYFQTLKHDPQQFSNGLAPIHLAVLGNRGSSVDELIKIGVDLNVKVEVEFQETFGINAMEIAISKGYIDIVEKLHNAGVVLNQVHAEVATYYDQADALQYLFDNNVDLNFSPNNVTIEQYHNLAHLAVNEGNIAVIKKLKELNIDVTIPEVYAKKIRENSIENNEFERLRALRETGYAPRSIRRFLAPNAGSENGETVETDQNCYRV